MDVGTERREISFPADVFGSRSHCIVFPVEVKSFYLLAALFIALQYAGRNYYLIALVDDSRRVIAVDGRRSLISHCRAL
ncbi:MAG: hypothetical protein Q8Q49_01625 [bacterium]|nr:hypothetical protein [bacterium]